MTRDHGRCRIKLLSMLLFASSGCGAPSLENPDAEQPQDPESRLVERSYPYQQGDATICAEYIVDHGDAREPTRRFEFYKFDVIRGELEADSAFRNYLKARLGLERIDGCESARLYVSARQAYRDANPQAESASDSTAVGLRDLLPIEPLQVAEVDKVAGVSTEFPPAVHLWTIGCSAFLIGRRWLVTAAHCRPTSGRFALSFVMGKGGDQSVVRPCSVVSANSTFVQTPGYVGSGDWANDFAIVEADCDFPAPADSPAVWARLSLTSAWPQEFVEPMGWGLSSHQGTGSGVLRRGERGIYVLQSSSHTFSSMASKGRARICEGDSGGPAVNFTSVAGAPIVMGVNLYHSGGSDYCPYPGDVMGFGQVATKRSWMAKRFAAGCNTYRSADGDVQYWRCW